VPTRRPFDDPWQRYPASKPRPVEQGIATSKQRGAMANAWWSARLVTLLDSYGLGARMQRGRRYARQGQLVSFEVRPGAVVADVQGSRSEPYAVTVSTRELTDAQWSAVRDAMRARAAFVAQLLAGHVPPELEAVFEDAGVPLLPARWRDVHARCSCPDPENPCKHVAAVLYVFADRLDDDPWLLLRWRGRERADVLADVGRAVSAGPSLVAPWWPLVPGAPQPSADDGRPQWELTDPAATLTRLGPLGVDVRSRPVTELLVDAYAAIIAET
jgi:SWIM zinc finger